MSHKLLNTETPRLIVDAGLKSLSLDSGPPKIATDSDSAILEYISQGDEHGRIKVSGTIGNVKSVLDQYKLGDIIRLVPGHCDPTANMYDYIIGVRDGIVETVWPIEGRGPGY